MSTDSVAELDPLMSSEAGPLGTLRRLSRRSVRLRSTIGQSALGARLQDALSWLTGPLDETVPIGDLDILERPSGLRRSGMVARITSSAHQTSLGFGLETPLVHALVDRLLGYERLDGEERLQITPVEWGIMTCAVARTLAEFTGASGRPDLVIDRVGPDPFPVEGLGPVVTLRWPIRIGSVIGSARFWVPEFLLLGWTESEFAARPVIDSTHCLHRYGSLAGLWRAEAGTVTQPRGLARPRLGSVLPIDGSQLRGTPASPDGPIALSLRDRSGWSRFPASCVPMSGGARLVLTGPPRRDVMPRETFAVNEPNRSEPNPGLGPTAEPASPAEVPVTLTVELGRISLPVHQVADLKAGDVLELARHAREPVELTSGGKLVARGELVQIDTELGVRVTNVFL